MDTLESNVRFRLMSGIFVFRDWFTKPRTILSETNLKRGDYVLDYGCGPGSFALEAAERVGRTGKVYALDVQPIALRTVEERAARKGLGNIRTIRSDCATGLTSASLDVVLLYDIFHIFRQPRPILEELHRVLKPDGLLSFSDHHMDEKAILDGVTRDGLFAMRKKGKKTYSFTKMRLPS